jgi:hypothetical protein
MQIIFYFGLATDKFFMGSSEHLGVPTFVTEGITPDFKLIKPQAIDQYKVLKRTINLQSLRTQANIKHVCTLRMSQNLITEVLAKLGRSEEEPRQGRKTSGKKNPRILQQRMNDMVW